MLRCCSAVRPGMAVCCFIHGYTLPGTVGTGGVMRCVLLTVGHVDSGSDLGGLLSSGQSGFASDSGSFATRCGIFRLAGVGPGLRESSQTPSPGTDHGMPSSSTLSDYGVRAGRTQCGRCVGVPARRAGDVRPGMDLCRNEPFTFPSSGLPESRQAALGDRDPPTL
ncbi:MAG: hypothetical protein WDW38_006254 [Sanguina aurantia]